MIDLLLLDALCRILRYLFLLVIPMRERLRITGWRAVLLLCGSTAIATAAIVSWIVWLPNTPYTRFLASCLGQLCSLLVFFLMTKGPFFPLLMVLLLQVCYGDNLKLIVRVVELSLYPDGMPGLAGALCSLGLTLVTLPLMYAIIRRLICPVIDKTGHQSFWKLLWQIPAINYILFRLSIYPSYITSREPLAFPWSLLLLLWPVVTLLIFSIILRLIHTVTDRLSLTARLEEERALLTMLEASYEQLQGDMEQSRIARHDMRHHLLAVQRLLASGHPEEADRYLAGCIQRITSEVQKNPESGSENR